MDKMRREFEKWAKNNHYDISWAEIIDDYEILRTRCAWDIWKASRAALVVELPATCCRTLIFEQDNTLEVGMEHGEYYEPDDIHAALDKAGIKYE